MRPLASSAISAVEVLDAHIERMRAVNPRLNAVVVDLSEEALKAAKAADKAMAKGRELGLLHGVPITIKENVDYEGRPNPNGVAAQMGIEPAALAKLEACQELNPTISTLFRWAEVLGQKLQVGLVADA